MKKALKFSVLGGFQLHCAESGEVLLRTRRTQVLLARVALGETAVDRSALTDLLWSTRSEEQARGSLRQALCELRKALPDNPALLIDRRSVGLDANACEVDALRFLVLADTDELAPLREAARLYQGEFLAGIRVRDPACEAWLQEQRERFRRQACDVLTRLLPLHGDDPPAREQTAQRLLELDPLDANAVRELMRLRADNGKPVLAMRLYERFRKQLKRDHDVLPDTDLQALYREVRRQCAHPRSLSASARPRWFPWQAARGGFALVAALLVAGVLAWFVPSSPHSRQTGELVVSVSAPPSIAVLPFTSLTDDPPHETFVEGLNTELVTGLAKLPGLRVAAISGSSAHSRSPGARRLRASYLLEGTVRRSPTRVRVNAQLIDTASGTHVWSERFDTSIHDPFAMQDELAGRIVADLSAQLAQHNAVPIELGGTANLAARHAFRRGWEYYQRFNAADNASAVAQFEKAVAADPDYARAHAALSLAYQNASARKGWNVPLGMTVEDAYLQRRAYFKRAIETPNTLAHTVVVEYHVNLGQHERAVAEAARAIALDPNDPEAHIAMASALIISGKPGDALRFVVTAGRLNPQQPSRYELVRAMAYIARDELDTAADVLRDALEANPSAVDLALPLASTYARLGLRPEARSALLIWKPEATQRELRSLSSQSVFYYKWRDQDWRIRERMYDGLHVAALPLHVTAESLTVGLEQQDFFQQVVSIKTLGRFGPAAHSATPVLIAALADENLRQEAAIALGKIGPAARAAISALTPLQDESLIGHFARRALLEIDGG